MKAHQLLISSKNIHRFHQDAGRVAVPCPWNSPRNLGCEPPVGVYEARTVYINFKYSCDGPIFSFYSTLTLESCAQI